MSHCGALMRTLRPFAVVAAMLVAGAAVAEAPAVDVTAYQYLLDDYLKIVTPEGEPLETRFDYERLYRDPDRGTQLERVRRQLLATSPKQLPEKERLAWAINTYNFLVLDAVTKNLYEPRVVRGRVKGVRGYVRRIQRSVQNISIGDRPFFEAPLVDVDGTSYSLREFERKFVFGGYDPASKKSRPKGLDPRLHFALTWGARSGPPLMPRAFRADSLDAQLDFATRNALSTFRQLRWDPAIGSLWVSQIFNWSAADFGGPDEALEFVKRYAPDSVRAGIEAKQVARLDHFLDWEWTLNQYMTKVAAESGVPAEGGDGAH